MVRVSGTLVDFVEDPSIVAQVQVRAREVRPHGDGVMLDHPVTVEWDRVTGVASFDAAAGTAGVIVWQSVGRSRSSGSLPLVVPDKATATLRECVEAVMLADEGTLDALQQMALRVAADAAKVGTAAQVERWAAQASEAFAGAQGIKENLPAEVDEELDKRVPPKVAAAIADDRAVADAAAAAVDDAAESIKWRHGAIAGGTDLDTVRTPGNYIVPTYARASGLLNGPGGEAVNRASVDVKSLPSGETHQVWTTLPGADFDAPVLSRRCDLEGVWTPWERTDDKADTTYVDAQDQELGQRITNEKWDRGNLSRDTDLDDIRTPGTYNIATWTVANNLVNKPSGAAVNRAVLIVHSLPGGETNQQWITLNALSLEAPIMRRRRDRDGAWSAWQREDIRPSQWELVGLPTDTLADITRSGFYSVTSWAAANRVVTPHGPLPHVESGVLEIHLISSSRREVIWRPYGHDAWHMSYSYGDWGQWKKLGWNEVPSHNHDSRYYTKAQTDSRRSALGSQLSDEIDQAFAAAKEYTDTSFAASPSSGGATDEAVDAAIDRAVQGGRIRVGAGILEAGRFGVVADGVTDDAPALLAAMTECVNDGVALALPANATLKLDSRVNAPAGLTLIANNATLAAGRDVNDFWLSIASDTTIVGSLNFEMWPEHSDRTRGITIEGSNVAIDDLNITCASQGVGGGSLLRVGLLVEGNDISFRRLRVNNHFRAVTITDSSRVRIDDMHLTGWHRGLYVKNTQHLTVSGIIDQVDPSAGGASGHNGVLVEASAPDSSSHLHFKGVVVDGAPASGFRIGGWQRVSNVHFDHCTARNIGTSGFKTLGSPQGGTERDENIIFDSCVAEDVGQHDANSAGIMVILANNVQIISPIFRRISKPTMGNHGIELQSVSHVKILNPIIEDPKAAGINISDSSGNVDDIQIRGGTFTTGHLPAIQFDISSHPYVTIGQVAVTDALFNGVAVETYGSTATLDRVTISGRVGAEDVAIGDVSRILADLQGPFTAVNFAPGSRWLGDDGVWRTLTAIGWAVDSRIQEVTADQWPSDPHPGVIYWQAED